MFPKEVSCGLPQKNGKPVEDSYKVHEDETLEFRLSDGDVGQCNDDDINERERIELKGENLVLDRRYSVCFKFQFADGLDSAIGTKFFQIHQHRGDESTNRAPAPILMLSIHKEGLLTIQPLKAPSNRELDDLHCFLQFEKGRSDFTKKYHNCRIDFSLLHGQLNCVTVSVDDEAITCKAWVENAGAPYLKCGLYRPKSGNGKNPDDKIYIKRGRVKQLEEPSKVQQE